jgi:catechol 2,3-dioxygenase-like lactoylglutathione lyase family enzyme
VRLPRRVWVEGDHRAQGPLDAREDGLDTRGVRRVLEERGRAQQLVGLRRFERLELRPDPGHRALEPQVTHAAGEQDRRDRPRGYERRRRPGFGLPPGRVRPALDPVGHERGPARFRCGRGQPVARAHDERLVPGVCLVEHAQRERQRRRLARRRTAVGLERVAEAPVGVAVGGDGVADGCGRPAVEGALEAAAVEHAGVGGEEAGGGVEVGRHADIPARPRAGVLPETVTSASVASEAATVAPRGLCFTGPRIACGRRPVGRVEVLTEDGALPIQLDHLAVAAKDKEHSATFLKDLLGLAEPTRWGPFVSLTLDDGIRLDYAEPGVDFHGQHYALLVSDEVFDRALDRIRAQRMPFWAGPGHTPGEINTNHGGRGVYFDDPSGHHFELITQRYGADL